MMKIKHLFGIMLLALPVLFTACSDDEYKVIYLFDPEDGNRITDGNVLDINCYREHDYIVRGGSGSYKIDYLEGGNVEAKWGANDTLKLTGNFPMDARIAISDNMNNTISLDINVEYLNRRYLVDSLYTEIKGGNLTNNQMQEMKARIKETSDFSKGCTFIFIYDNEDDLQMGQLRITDSQSQRVGGDMTFREEKEVKVEGTITKTYQPIHVYDESGTVIHEYVLTKEYTSDMTNMEIQLVENVRDEFKDEPYYSNIDEANVYYKVSELEQK